VCLAIPAQVVEVLDEANQLARVDVDGVRRTVNVGLLDGAGGAVPGEWVLVHVGFALSRIDEVEAQATLELLREAMSEYDQALEELKGSAIE
jgi:hydrogenase expression/formation protein HypC